ncbi:MAG: hypothetical protein LBN23_02230, partial [Paludibacter sp.]|nr:hypothetical protein [Paludibacter sp.]
TPETALLFNQLQKTYGEIIESNFPRGMLRIINVEKFLRIFAENNPEKEFEFNVFDETISENCGNYYLKNTFFVKNNEFNKNLSTLSVKDLAEFIFNKIVCV